MRESDRCGSLTPTLTLMNLRSRSLTPTPTPDPRPLELARLGGLPPWPAIAAAPPPDPGALVGGFFFLTKFDHIFNPPPPLNSYPGTCRPFARGSWRGARQKATDWCLDKNEWTILLKIKKKNGFLFRPLELPQDVWGTVTWHKCEKTEIL